MKNRLVWIAVGAALSAAAFSLAAFFNGITNDQGNLVIDVRPEKTDQNKAIFAVRSCIDTRFIIEMPYDGFHISVPLKELDSHDFSCLIKNLAPVRHAMWIE